MADVPVGGRKSRVPTVGTQRRQGDRTVGGEEREQTKPRQVPGLRHQAYSQDKNDLDTVGIPTMMVEPDLSESGPQGLGGTSSPGVNAGPSQLP